MAVVNRVECPAVQADAQFATELAVDVLAGIDLGERRLDEGGRIPPAFGAELQRAAKQVAGLLAQMPEIAEPPERRGLRQKVLHSLGQRRPPERGLEPLCDSGSDLDQFGHGGVQMLLGDGPWSGEFFDRFRGFRFFKASSGTVRRS